MFLRHATTWKGVGIWEQKVKVEKIKCGWYDGDKFGFITHLTWIKIQEKQSG